MTFKNPASFYQELPDERLPKITEPLLDIRYTTIQETSSPFDDTNTQETAVFGRSRNLLTHLCSSAKYQWLSFVKQAWT
jgi:hypothetical protein